MGLKLPAILDVELLNRPGEEYFPAWLEKHRSERHDKEFKTVRKTHTIQQYFSNTEDPL